MKCLKESPFEVKEFVYKQIYKTKSCNLTIESIVVHDLIHSKLNFREYVKLSGVRYAHKYVCRFHYVFNFVIVVVHFVDKICEL